MWDEFRALDNRRQELTTLLEEMEEREAVACERADRIERKVFRLTRKYGRLLQDKEETEEWIAEVENLGGGLRRSGNGRRMRDKLWKQL
jgi:hypothetical protein